MGRGRP
ncbi:hypothetical protein LINPERPRIM_LOCUS14538 [Linum perenne]